VSDSCIVYTNDPDHPYHPCQKYVELQAENDKMRKAILSWWRGSPEDTDSEKELYRIALEIRTELEQLG
jgi:hypothetical protein